MNIDWKVMMAIVAAAIAVASAFFVVSLGPEFERLEARSNETRAQIAETLGDVRNNYRRDLDRTLALVQETKFNTDAALARIEELRVKIAVLEDRKAIPGPAGPRGDKGEKGDPGGQGKAGLAGKDAALPADIIATFAEIDILVSENKKLRERIERLENKRSYRLTDFAEGSAAKGQQCKATAGCRAGEEPVATHCLLKSGIGNLQNADGGGCVFNCTANCSCRVRTMCAVFSP